MKKYSSSNSSFLSIYWNTQILFLGNVEKSLANGTLYISEKQFSYISEHMFRSLQIKLFLFTSFIPFYISFHTFSPFCHLTPESYFKLKRGRYLVGNMILLLLMTCLKDHTLLRHKTKSFTIKVTFPV